MQQMIRMIQEQAGIDEEQARRAAETVVGFLKERLPGPMAGQLDGVLQGDKRTDGASRDRRSSMGDQVSDAIRNQPGNPLA